MAHRGKPLAESGLLMGTTEEITMMDLRNRAGDVITQVQMGKVFTITKLGKAVAVLSRLERSELELGAEVRRLGVVGQ